MATALRTWARSTPQHRLSARIPQPCLSSSARFPSSICRPSVAQHSASPPDEPQALQVYRPPLRRNRHRLDGSVAPPVRVHQPGQKAPAQRSDLQFVASRESAGSRSGPQPACRTPGRCPAPPCAAYRFGERSPAPSAGHRAYPPAPAAPKAWAARHSASGRRVKASWASAPLPGHSGRPRCG